MTSAGRCGVSPVISPVSYTHLLAIGMVLVVAIWASLYFAPGGTVSSPVQMVGIVLSYVIILGDFIYDFARIRPLRNMYRCLLYTSRCV